MKEMCAPSQNVMNGNFKVCVESALYSDIFENDIQL